MTEAILLVGGYGTRLKPLTIHTPKPMLEVAGFPVEQVAFEVSVQLMVFPLAGTKSYDELVAPETAVPFTFH